MREPPKAVVTVRLLRESGHAAAAVKGGAFKTVQTMDWVVLNDAGETVGVLGRESAAKTISRLAELHRLLVEIDGLAHLRQRYDNGYLEIPVEMFRALEKLLAPQ